MEQYKSRITATPDTWQSLRYDVLLLLLFGVNIIFISSLRDPKETEWIFGRDNEIKKVMLNWYFELPVLKYAALMASEKTLKIPSIESTDNLEPLIKEELPSLFPTGLKTIKLKQLSSLVKNCAKENS